VSDLGKNRQELVLVSSVGRQCFYYGVIRSTSWVRSGTYTESKTDGRKRIWSVK
jgi:hypothetical protein